MKVVRTSADAFTVEFESEAELKSEYENNLSMGGLRLLTGETVKTFASLTLTMRLGSRSASARASVVGALPGALALAVEGKPADLLAALTPAADGAEDAGEAVAGNAWDRLRALSRMERLLLAPKAERSERAILMQDSDPQVLFNLLKNPRIGAEEVARLAKSSYLSFQTAELIVKTSQWVSNLEVKLALVHNPKTPPAMALRILPTLPMAEVAKVARGAAVTQALKQSALKLLIASG